MHFSFFPYGCSILYHKRLKTNVEFENYYKRFGFELKNFICYSPSRFPLETISGTIYCPMIVPVVLPNLSIKANWINLLNRRNLISQSSLYIEGTEYRLIGDLNRGFWFKLNTVFCCSFMNFSYSLLSFMDVQHLRTRFIINICL